MARLGPQVGAMAVALARAEQGADLPGGPETIFDPVAGRGPLGGVLAGLSWARALGAGWLATVPVDGPFLPLDLVARLQSATGDDRTPRLARAGGREHPTFALWPVALAATLAEFLASGAPPRLRDFARASGAVWVDFPEEAAFLNLNTPQDLAEAEARLTGGRP
jgi:molybdopterin-guanine dinucleotide biosynthesis protein A